MSKNHPIIEVDSYALYGLTGKVQISGIDVFNAIHVTRVKRYRRPVCYHVKALISKFTYVEMVADPITNKVMMQIVGDRDLIPFYFVQLKPKNQEPISVSRFRQSIREVSRLYRDV